MGYTIHFGISHYRKGVCMAWYAELRRRKWYCINRFDMIGWYSKYLYDKWYASLTEEEKAYLEEIKRERKEREDKDLQESMMKLLMLSGFISKVYSKTDKYHGVYDKNGYPRT